MVMIRIICVDAYDIDIFGEKDPKKPSSVFYAVKVEIPAIITLDDTEFIAMMGKKMKKDIDGAMNFLPKPN